MIGVLIKRVYKHYITHTWIAVQKETQTRGILKLNRLVQLRGTDLHSKCSDVSGLQVHSTRSNKLTGQTLAGAHVGDNSSRGNALELILAVPSDKMTVIHEVRFSLDELEMESRN
jgi:hypothetical protein